LKSPLPDDPKLLVIKGGDLSLPSGAVIALMQAVIGKGLPFRFRAKGSSMFPFIRDGDIVTVAPLGQSLPPVGDVVAFIRPSAGDLVVHRVVDRRTDACLMRGDSATCGPDGWIERASMLGGVTRVEHGGRGARLGMGPERRVIAALSRHGLLWPLVSALHRVLRPVVRPLLGRNSR
jgi:hypothetical protein